MAAPRYDANGQQPLPMSSRSSSADDKHNAIKNEYAYDEIPDPDADLSEEEKARIDKALVRKLDFQLIPWVMTFPSYVCCFY